MQGVTTITRKLKLFSLHYIKTPIVQHDILIYCVINSGMLWPMYMWDVKFLRSAACLCSHSKCNVDYYVNTVIKPCGLLNLKSSILSNYSTLPCITLDTCPGHKVRSTLNISVAWWLKTHVRRLRRSSCQAGSTMSWLSSQERAASLLLLQEK